MEGKIYTKNQLHKVVEILNHGGVILYPTESVWGLGCDATNDNAIRRIFEIKNRPQDNKMLSLLAEVREIFTYVSNPWPNILDDLSSYKSPTTFVFPDVVGISPLLLKSGSGAFRISQSTLCKTIIKQMGKPLVSTSANLSGLNPSNKLEDISPIIKNNVDGILLPIGENNELDHPITSIYLCDATGIKDKIR